MEFYNSDLICANNNWLVNINPKNGKMKTSIELPARVVGMTTDFHTYVTCRESGGQNNYLYEMDNFDGQCRLLITLKEHSVFPTIDVLKTRGCK